jgi:phenylalanyl-tRNA synthetase alpha subunit
MHSSSNSFKNAPSTGDVNYKIYQHLDQEFSQIKKYNVKALQQIEKLSSEISDLKTSFSSEISILRSEVVELKEQNALLTETMNVNNKSQQSCSNSKHVFTMEDEDKIRESFNEAMFFVTIFNEINANVTNFVTFR